MSAASRRDARTGIRLADIHGIYRPFSQWMGLLTGEWRGSKAEARAWTSGGSVLLIVGIALIAIARRA
jgi:hypothetical protein